MLLKSKREKMLEDLYKKDRRTEKGAPERAHQVYNMLLFCIQAIVLNLTMCISAAQEDNFIKKTKRHGSWYSCLLSSRAREKTW